MTPESFRGFEEDELDRFSLSNPFHRGSEEHSSHGDDMPHVRDWQ
jgi:hypothetical protein